MTDLYVTIVGFSHYCGINAFPIGMQLLCVKEPDNAHDNEAIKVTLPLIGTVGYIANGVNTKANGTLTAGRLYEKVGESFNVRVLFTTPAHVIARVEQSQPGAPAEAADPVSF